MDSQVFAQWLVDRGDRVVWTESSYWHEASPRVYQAVPYHWLIQPSARELEHLFRDHHALAIRFSSPVDAPQGKLSYHVVCEGDYKFENLSRQARQSAKRGLKYVDVDTITFDRLADEGWHLREDTLARQGRSGAESQQWWRRLCATAEKLPGFEAWGALHEGQLVASFLGFTCDDCYLLPYEQSATAHLEFRVNNAIFYEVTRKVLQRSSIDTVFFCLQSLDAPCSVDEFKFRMGYRARPVRQRVAFHPRLAFLFNSASHQAVARLVKLMPKQPALAKAEGMVRFYLDGLRPVADQNWPETLLDRRLELLSSMQT